MEVDRSIGADVDADALDFDDMIDVVVGMLVAVAFVTSPVAIEPNRCSRSGFRHPDRDAQ